MEDSTPFGIGFSDALSGKLLNRNAPSQEYFDRYHKGYQAGYTRLNEFLSAHKKQEEQSA